MKKTIIIFLSSITMLSLSCSKDWLDIKPTKASVVPQTLKDYQALLDDEITMNRVGNLIGLQSNDLIYISEDDLGQLSEEAMDMYTWQKTIKYGLEGSNSDWNENFAVIRSANLVIDGIKQLNIQNTEGQHILAQAHFFRALGYYRLAQFFCKPYSKDKASADLGLPLRLASDVNTLEKRSNLKELYNFILSDLQYASANLDYEPKYFTRASKTAALAILAKLHLSMREYPVAKKYADSIIAFKPTLIDFNNQQYVSHNFAYQFLPKGIGNPEIIFYAQGGLTNFEVSYQGSIPQVDSNFYNSYAATDLRKEFYYGKSEGRINFIGNYNGDNRNFNGISTNELYFIRSECNARLNNLADARADLNLILKNRFLTGTAPIITESDPDALLKLIISEKTKEFPRFSNIWWEDLRRLNQDERFQRTLKRIIRQSSYELPPNDLRYTFPIPEKEIRQSGLEQNLR